MSDADDQKQAAGVRSMEMGSKILFALARIGKPATLSEIAAETATAPAKLHRYLVSMLKSGLVAQPKKSGVYCLGAGAIQIGLSALQHNDFCSLMGPRLDGIRDALDVTCFAAVMGNMGPTVFAQAIASNTVAIFVRVGSVLPMDRSATGWTFGAYISERQYRALRGIDRDKQPPDVVDRYATVRRLGCSAITDEYVRGISAISYPVFGMNDTIEGAVTALGATGSFDNAIDGAISRHLREVCAEVSASLGWRPR